MSQSEIINKIYEDYLDVVAPLTIQYEDITNAFPTGILNEIRDVMFHIAKAESGRLDKGEDIDGEITKAKRHMTRAMRDCYKYICAAMENIYQNFQVKQKQLCNKIKTEQDKNNYFLVEKTHFESMQLLTNAREMEIDPLSKEKDEEIYSAYKIAVENYKKLVENIYKYYSKK